VQLELVALREENAKLRLEGQRALDLGRATERIRDAVATATVAGDAEGDAWDALTEATVMRTALLAVCEDLQKAVGITERRLRTQIPGPELDRRLGDQPQGPWAGAANRRAKAMGVDGSVAPPPIPRNIEIDLRVIAVRDGTTTAAPDLSTSQREVGV